MNGTLKLTHKLTLPNGQTIELTSAELDLVRDELDRLLGPRRDYPTMPWMTPVVPQAPMPQPYEPYGPGITPCPTYPPPQIWCRSDNHPG